MPRPDRFARSVEDVARALGLSIQEVRWAEQSAMRKLKQSELSTVDVDQYSYDNHELRTPRHDRTT